MTRLILAAALLFSMLQQAAFTETTAAAGLEFRFHTDEGVTAEDESYVREGLRLAQDFLSDDVGVTVTGDVNVNLRSSGAPLNPGEIAEARNGYIAYFTESMGWTRSSPTFRIEVVIHEFVHVYQTEALGRSSSPVPAWMMEGSAEYLAAEALISRGLLEREDADAYRYWSIADVSLDPLAEYETVGAFRQADARVYGLAYLGVDALIEAAGTEAIGAFFADVGSGNDWAAAFEAAFAVTPGDFYRTFEQGRRDFPEPANPPAVYADVDPTESASPVRITDASGFVAPGEQLLVQARSEPNARCTAYLWGESLDLAHETTADGAANLFWLVTIPGDTPLQSAEISVDCGVGPVTDQIEIRARPHLDHPGR
jgi:hypothetical protein